MRRSKKLGAVALAEAKKLKATYADVRIGDQRIGLRLSPERGTGKTLTVPNVTEDSSFGFGVRVIVNGAWGFASSPIVTPEDMTMKASRPRSGRSQACQKSGVRDC
jgi:TldD protein